MDISLRQSITTRKNTVRGLELISRTDTFTEDSETDLTVDKWTIGIIVAAIAIVVILVSVLWRYYGWHLPWFRRANGGRGYIVDTLNPEEDYAVGYGSDSSMNYIAGYTASFIRAGDMQLATRGGEDEEHTPVGPSRNGMYTSLHNDIPHEMVSHHTKSGKRHRKEPSDATAVFREPFEPDDLPGVACKDANEETPEAASLVHRVRFADEVMTINDRFTTRDEDIGSDANLQVNADSREKDEKTDSACG
ncbi:uncharacterized protein SPPG_01036 [Spizellomyces punctatus DAOM BR117]|uniref:Uncharacterized protein n=1 Tax=Spizellomyces punctatus (strain DAOM BR117) TaxID=645134 RepID=A0A0L0HQA8_SPIPD|nr:uncharacterized protein SPPG_01036 [Spizellomyces punctatus DAOM BR117]KND03561.1 hypothetical protein SPPG_01036 [Spizellomyces punctatus DAOM BR117]|eukprot:XP_016611600.1 hypothetical protein SPPG_01036 [Spizellomyces punctatus DAOM BR117]